MGRIINFSNKNFWKQQLKMYHLECLLESHKYKPLTNVGLFNI